MLILLILMSTIFAGIALRMQTKMQDLPDLLRDDQIKRESENISDYALRYAIAYAIPKIKEWVDKNFETVTVKFDGTTVTNGNLIGMPVFPVGNGFIRQITFKHIGGTFTGGNKEVRFQAISDVSGTLMSKTIVYPAELAFNYFKVETPNCFYYEMNQAQLEGQADLNDTSGNGNNGYPFNGLHTFPTPGDGVAGWKCGFWHGDFNDAAYAPNDNVNHTMEVDTTFTLVCFAKPDIDLKYRSAALVWMPSVQPQGDLAVAPSMAIWYSGVDGNMHFTVGLSDFAPYNWLQVEFPFKERLVAQSPSSSTGSGYRNYPWEFFALTFNKGTLKAYYNGLPITSVPNPVTSTCTKAVKSKWGVSIGARITRLNGTNGDGFYNSNFDRCFHGVMDQVGLFNRALNDQEIWDFYTFTQMPTKVDYIRD
jgi:hypothetical protein